MRNQPYHSIIPETKTKMKLSKQKHRIDDPSTKQDRELPIRLLKQFAHKNDRTMSDQFSTSEERAKSGFKGEGHRCEEVPLEVTLEQRERIGEMLEKKNHQIYKTVGKDFATLRRVVEHNIDQGMEIIVNPPDVTEGKIYE